MKRKRKLKLSKKKEEWTFTKWDGPPYSYSVKVNGKIKRMSGFDVEHIQNQFWEEAGLKNIIMANKIKSWRYTAYVI